MKSKETIKSYKKYLSRVEKFLSKNKDATVQDWMFSLKRSVQGPAKAAMIYYGKLDKNFKVEKYHSVSHRSLSEKEREIILSDLSDNLVLKNLVIAFLETGVRRSEIQELVKNYKDISNVVEIIGKGNKKRTIPLNKSAIKAIGYLKNQKFDINSQATNLWRRKNKINIDFSFHNLRSTFANNLKQIGIDLNTIKDILGHENLMATEKYLTSSTEEKLEAVNSLEELEKGNYSNKELMALYLKSLLKIKKQKEYIEKLENR